MRVQVQHADCNADNGRGMSQSVWGGMGIDQALFGLDRGIYHKADFLTVAAAPSSPIEGIIATSTGTLAGDADDGGTLDNPTGAVANNKSSLVTPDFGDLDVSANTDPKMCWEGRFQLDSVADFGALFGIMQQGDTINSNLSSGAVANTNALYGFHISSGNSDLKFYPVYTDAGVGVTTETGSATVVAAATWFKVGFRVTLRPDGSGPNISYYLNGDRIYTVNDTIASTIEDLTAMIGFALVETLAAAAKTLKCDWMAFYAATP